MVGYRLDDARPAPACSASPSSRIQSLGVHVRYVAEQPSASAFYTERLRLPLIRAFDTARIYWAGEATTFETITVPGKIHVPGVDAMRNAWRPAFRVTDMATLAVATTDAAGQIERRTLADGTSELQVLDEHGLEILLRQRPENADIAQDVEARRRAKRGETFNPGCAAMPDGMPALGWIVRRVVDLDRIAAFYEALGFTPVAQQNDALLLDMGDNVLLELQRGGVVHPIPVHRYDVPDAPLLRVSGLAQIKTDMLRLGGAIVHESVPIPWGDLAYFADPEGGTFGMEENFHPGAARDGKFFLAENLEGARRWRERLAQEAE